MAKVIHRGCEVAKELQKRRDMLTKGKSAKTADRIDEKTYAEALTKGSKQREKEGSVKKPTTDENSSQIISK